MMNTMDKTAKASRILTGKISVFMALVCLWALFLSQVHHHEDAGHHHDCPICVFLAQPAADVSVSTEPCVHDELVGCICFIESVRFISTPLFLTGPQRAPPA